MLFLVTGSWILFVISPRVKKKEEKSALIIFPVGAAGFFKENSLFFVISGFCNLADLVTTIKGFSFELLAEAVAEVIRSID